MLVSVPQPQELSTATFTTLFSHQNPLLNPPQILITSLPLPMRTSSLFSPLPLLLRSLHRHYHHCRRHPHSPLLLLPTKTHKKFYPISAFKSLGTSVEHLACETEEKRSEVEIEAFRFDENVGFGGAAVRDLKHLDAPAVEVRELEELPDQWRRARLAWLCKELPAHKAATLVRILNAQKKWMRQEDATYVVVHCTRIRENEAAFRVYKWMIQQHWYRFDFALATKLADFMGKDVKFAKCREIFDDIINQGRVPSESTFHILVVAYLSAPVQGCLEEACSIYNRMIQLGGYKPRLSLHNALFRALVGKPGVISKQYLKQAEFIYHNIATSGLNIQKDIYGGLIWLHSYQETIDKERITSLREEMKQAGIEEGIDVLLSVLRACSKEGDVEEAERTWVKLLNFGGRLPSQAFVSRMEGFAKVGEPMKSLEIFREMQEHLNSPSVAAYHKIIEVLCGAKQTELVESLIQEFINSDMKPLVPSFIDLMNMYLSMGMHEKLESAFFLCLEKCPPNRTVYGIYLDSLLEVGDIVKAEEIFNHMCTNEMVGVNSKICNTILSAYLSSGDHVKAEKVYDLMCQKKYDIEPSLMEKLDFVLSLRRRVVKKPISLKLSKEQREILVGLLLGGMQIESDEERKQHMIRFEFRENCGTHSILRRHLHHQYYEWLHPSCKPSDDSDVIPYRFSTIAHSYFGFYADQFWPKGRQMIPKLIHRWLSPRTLAYWFMYGGHRTASGDILLKLKGSSDGVGKIVKTFKAMSLDCRVKQKGRVFWIGFLGSNSTWFWKLIEPYVLDDMKDFLKADDPSTEINTVETQVVNFDNGSDLDEEAPESSDTDTT